MATQRRKFQRPLGERRYKKLFLIAAEGIQIAEYHIPLDLPRVADPQMVGIRIHLHHGGVDFGFARPERDGIAQAVGSWWHVSDPQC